MDYPFVNERFNVRDRSGRLHWVTCTECAHLMAAHNADPSIQVTRAMVKDLYGIAATHYANGGSDAAMIDRELVEHFGHKGARVHSFAELRAALNAGAVAGVAVLFNRLDRPLQAYGRAFATSSNPLHAITVGPAMHYINGGPARDLYLVRDPLAADAGDAFHAAWRQFAPALLGSVYYNARVYFPNAWRDQPASQLL